MYRRHRRGGRLLAVDPAHSPMTVLARLVAQLREISELLQRAVERVQSAVPQIFVSGQESHFCSVFRNPEFPQPNASDSEMSSRVARCDPQKKEIHREKERPLPVGSRDDGYGI